MQAIKDKSIRRRHVIDCCDVLVVELIHHDGGVVQTSDIIDSGCSTNSILILKPYVERKKPKQTVYLKSPIEQKVNCGRTSPKARNIARCAFMISLNPFLQGTLMQYHHPELIFIISKYHEQGQLCTLLQKEADYGGAMLRVRPMLTRKSINLIPWIVRFGVVQFLIQFGFLDFSYGSQGIIVSQCRIIVREYFVILRRPPITTQSCRVLFARLRSANSKTATDQFQIQILTKISH